MKHFLKETDFTLDEVAEIFALARRCKQQRGQPGFSPLAGQTWAMIFSKSSTRTRVSFEVGIHELGGNPLFLSRNDIQLGRGESIADTARVLSRFVHGLVVRTFAHTDVEELARWGNIPVVNALTDLLHPCQFYTDAFSAAEKWAGPEGNFLTALEGRKIAFLGDTSFNMANSWIMGAAHFGMKLALSGPAGYEPREPVHGLLAAQGLPCDYLFTTDPFEAVADADVVYTDVWASMGHEEEIGERHQRMRPYAVTERLFAAAKPDALFMHCLPAHPGEEVDQAVVDDPRSIIFDQAENRLHVQKAILSVLARQARA
jgi:ornithine carbamoyltransferase